MPAFSYNSGRSQSRSMSFIEVMTNVTVGYVIALLTQIFSLPWFGFQLSLEDNLLLGAIFTVTSVLRSYALRRIFESFRALD